MTRRTRQRLTHDSTHTCIFGSRARLHDRLPAFKLGATPWSTPFAHPSVFIDLVNARGCLQGGCRPSRKTLIANGGHRLARGQLCIHARRLHTLGKQGRPSGVPLSLATSQFMRSKRQLKIQLFYICNS
jgi:hypothetical protein